MFKPNISRLQLDRKYAREVLLTFAQEGKIRVRLIGDRVLTRKAEIEEAEDPSYRAGSQKMFIVRAKFTEKEIEGKRLARLLLADVVIAEEKIEEIIRKQNGECLLTWTIRLKS